MSLHRTAGRKAYFEEDLSMDLDVVSVEAHVDIQEWRTAAGVGDGPVRSTHADLSCSPCFATNKQRPNELSTTKFALKGTSSSCHVFICCCQGMLGTLSGAR